MDTRVLHYVCMCDCMCVCVIFFFITLACFVCWGDDNWSSKWVVTDRQTFCQLVVVQLHCPCKVVFIVHIKNMQINLILIANWNRENDEVAAMSGGKFGWVCVAKFTVVMSAEQKYGTLEEWGVKIYIYLENIFKNIWSRTF